MNFTSKANGLIDIITHNHTLSFSKKFVREGFERFNSWSLYGYIGPTIGPETLTPLHHIYALSSQMYIGV